MEFLSRYIVLLVVAICLCLGYIIKHSITFIPNKYIPLIMAISGVILNLWLNNWSFTPEILLGGLVSGLASTGTHQMIRNIIPKEFEKVTGGINTGVAAMSLRRKKH